MNEGRKAIIIGVSSDIGEALGREWRKEGWEVFGTYRNKEHISPADGAKLIHCDLADSASIAWAAKELKKACPAWDALVLCPATLLPIGLFADTDIDEWKNSFELNFINQMKIVRMLLPSRNVDSRLGPCVLFFSGSGINESTANCSSYTVSKIAAIKMAEILDAEIPDTRFVSVGPGWVDTKIHRETLEAGLRAGRNRERTIEKINKKDFTPMKQVVGCCTWATNASKEVVSGRNINVVHDAWGDKEFEKKLIEDSHLLKLRKYGTIKNHS